MAADGLASAHSAVFEADTLNTIPFVVEGNVGQPVAISFHIHATSGQLDPAAPEIRTSTGDVVPAMFATDDYQGTSDSLIVVQLAAGSYQIRVGGEQSTTGEFDVHAGLLGDANENGQVTKSDYQHLTAAMVQSQFGFTGVSAQVFNKLGINTGQNLYRSEYDVDGNGKIDAFDQSVIESSIGAPTVELEFMVDNQGPTITAAMVGDTGRSTTDGITNNLNATIDGTIADTMPIISFTGSVDGSTAVELGTLLGQNFSAGGSFSITRAQLEQIAGNTTVVNNGSHTLLLSATDQQGNTSTRQLTFEFDTIAPAAPTTLDLDASSDTGSSNSDNITRMQQLLLRADAETNSLVQFFSSMVTGSIGQGIASSPVSATSSTLPEGTQNITATSTDVAGNTSSSSAPLSVTIDITAPATPTFALAEASDTGTLGDHLTTLSSVTFTGTTSANAAVELRRGGSTVATSTANGSGAFSFDNVTLPFGASSFQVVATDPAGNSSTSASQTITRQHAPTAEDQEFDVSVKYADATVVGTVAADDQDDDSLTFEIIDGEFPEGAFTIDENTGEIRVFNAGELGVGSAHTLVVQVTDEHGESLASPITITLHAVDNLPLTAQDDDAATDEDTPIIIDVLVDNGHGADSDPDDPLVDLVVSDHDEMSTLGATITLEQDGTLRYDPTAVLDHLPLGEMVVDTFTYTVMDPGGATSTATVFVTVTGVNDPPVARDDEVSTNEDQPLAINPLLSHANGPDIDPDDGDTIVVFSVANASDKGALISIENGIVVYNPFTAPMVQELDEGEELVDMFDYTIVDSHGALSTGTISVTVTGSTNDPIPVDDELETNEDTPITFDPLADNGNGPDSDQDGDDPELLMVTGTSGMSAHGALIILHDDGTVTYDPRTSEELQKLLPSETIVDTFQYTVTDGVDGTSLGTVFVTVTGLEADPSFLTISDQDVYAGAPLLVPLNGIDGDAQDLTFTAVTEDGEVLEAIVYSGSRSLSLTIAGYGEMRFYLFEELVPGVTDPMIEYIESGLADGTILHRILNGFVAQGLDPTGTGAGHPGLPDFDDQFHLDLQHTSSGILSMAKGGDDTNGQQPFISDVNPAVRADSYLALRRLDFNHSVFARLTLGENIRQQIMLVPVAGDGSGRPTTDLVVTNAEIIEDNMNAVLMLKAPNGVSGNTSVTVTVTDTAGNSYDQSFEVTVTPDIYNASPFLKEYPTSATTTVNTPVELQIAAVDDEGDDFVFSAVPAGVTARILFDNSGGETDITTPGTTDFAYLHSTWSGGTVATSANPALLASGTQGYQFDSDGEVVFDVPVTDIAFQFVHSSGVPEGTATFFDADGNELGSIDSRAATTFNDGDNFFRYTALNSSGNQVGPVIKRIEFTGGMVDTFTYTTSPIDAGDISVDNATGVVTVTPPEGFVGVFAVKVNVEQAPDEPVVTANDPAVDSQVILITVLPADPLTAAEGGSGQAAASIGADDALLAEAFQSALATWQSVLGLSQLPDIRLNVADLGDARLGAASVVTVNSAALPSSSVITIDDDGAGRGWHSSLDQAVAQDRYDLYTVLLHEVGHALGFHQAADSVGMTDGALDAYFDAYGHVVGLEDDLMSDELPLGTRRLPSALDVDLLRLAYGLDAGDSAALDALFADWNLAG